jgi:hypothetical protein
MAAVDTAAAARAAKARAAKARAAKAHNEPARPVRDLRRFWRTALAVLAPLPVLALAVELFVVPFPVRGDIAQAMAGIATHPGRAQVALWLAMIYTLLIVPATMAVAWTARRGAPRLTLAGGVLTILAFSASLPNSDVAEVVGVQKGLGPAAVQAIDDAVWAHPAMGVQLAIFLLGQAIGLILLGVALWRARVVPAWAGIVLALSGPAHLVAPGGNAGAAISWAMTAVGYAAASVALLRTRDADFDLPPADRPEPAASTNAGHDARTAWRWLLALAATPVAIYVAVFRYFIPYQDSDSPRQIFDTLVAATTYQSMGIWIGSFVVLTGFAGILAVAWHTRRRTPVLTTIALVLAVPGFLALFAGGPYGDVLAYVTGTVPGIDRETAFQLGYGMESSAQSGLLTTIFVLGHLVGTTLLGVALWRARIAPTWLAIGLTVSQPIHLSSVMTGIRPIDLVGWGLTAVGFGWAAWRLAKLHNDEFDLAPVAR